MADSFDRFPSQPRANWSQAFAALPLETPPVDGWQRLARSLDSPASDARPYLDTDRSRRRFRRRRGHWFVAMASAAAVALIAWMPVSRWLHASGPSPATTATVAPPHSSTTTASVRRSDLAARDRASGRFVDARTQPAQVTTVPEHERAYGRVDRALAQRATDRLIAALPALHAGETVAATAGTDAAAASASSLEALPQLQAQSAQLEALVALARDDRVCSGSGLMITNALEAAIAQIDADLAQPHLDASQLVALWQQRVQVLQQLAGIESTERWLAAQGERYDSQLVSVY